MRLHIGGKVAAPGWTVLNIEPGPCVDVVGSCTDLSAFADGRCQEVYASHVLEHLRYEDELPQALKEFFRVLRPGGVLRVAVPDLDFLCRLFVLPDLTFDQRFTVMQLMFGGHSGEHDVHMVGFNQEILTSYLDDAGFVAIVRVEDFGLFDDSSSLTIAGHPISLNVEMRKPRHG
ncbi:MAG: methyltransferase domain-containing protein [Alphaproteobacteria bacterium]